jgi:hypothetical protein|nr:MAG TPA: tail assembly chaperone protein [Caudoviricetes sp.]
MDKIKVYGKEYPMRMTMGAMLRFQRTTGKDVSQMGTDVSLMIVFLHCCVTSACNADGVTFDLDLDKFADGLDMNVLNDFAESLSAGTGDSKKKPEKTPTSAN